MKGNNCEMPMEWRKVDSHNQLLLETSFYVVLYLIHKMFSGVVYYTATPGGPRTSEQDRTKNWECTEIVGNATFSKQKILYV